jgi:hypothetical protein
VPYDPDGEVILVQHAQSDQIADAHRLWKAALHALFRRKRMIGGALRLVLCQNDNRGPGIALRRCRRARQAEYIQQNSRAKAHHSQPNFRYR